MRRLTTVVAGLLTAFAGVCGGPVIEWLGTTWEFGAFEEEGGLKTAVFKYRNAGDEPLVIIGARANCGCTTPRYNDAPLAPGDTAQLVVSYDPSGRPGRFEKKVYVDTNTDPRRSTLTVKGVVVGAPSSLAARYPVEVGPLRLSHPAVLLGTINRGHVKSVFENAYNASADTLRPVVVDAPKWLDVKTIPAVAGPGEQVSFNFFVKSDKIPDWDIVTDTVTVVPDPGSAVTMRLPVVVTVNEDFGALTDRNRAEAPVAVIEPRRHEPVEVGDSPVTFSFKIENQGKKPLRVRRVYTRTDGVDVGYARDKAIKPGKSADVTVRVSPVVPGSRDAVSLTLTIITNDPARPRQTYNVSVAKM